jgi:hypothetical protein
MRKAAAPKTDTLPFPGGGQRLRDTRRAPDGSDQRVVDLALSGGSPMPRVASVLDAAARCGTAAQSRPGLSASIR